MPLAGIWAAKGEISFPMVMVLTVFAGLTGSVGAVSSRKIRRREGDGNFYFKETYPKHRPVIEEKMAFLREKGGTGVFVSKLLPMVRTLISIPAGMVKMNFTKYTVSSAMRNLPVESGVCRRGIFLRRCGDQFLLHKFMHNFSHNFFISFEK